MIVFSQHYRPQFGTLVAVASCALSFAAFAQSVTPPARVEAPDGAPVLATERSVTNVSPTAPPRATSVIVEEERVQGRLANARVSVGGVKGYTIVDPNAGRVDRQADNGGKRLSPSLWELFRF